MSIVMSYNPSYQPLGQIIKEFICIQNKSIMYALYQYLNSPHDLNLVRVAQSCPGCLTRLKSPQFKMVGLLNAPFSKSHIIIIVDFYFGYLEIPSTCYINMNLVTVDIMIKQWDQLNYEILEVRMW